MSRKSVCSVAAAAAMILAGAGSATAKELIYGSGIPAKSDQMRVGMKTYTEDLAKASNGALTMKVLAGGQVVSLYNTLAALRDGTIDAGFIVPTFTRKELKHVNVVYDTEIFGVDPAAITGAANETLLLNCPSCMKDFRDNRARLSRLVRQQPEGPGLPQAGQDRCRREGPQDSRGRRDHAADRRDGRGAGRHGPARRHHRA